MNMGVEHKITGIAQLIAVSIIILHLYFSLLPSSASLFAVAYFVIKGISFALFKRNPLSILDAISGIYLIFPVTGMFSNSILNMVSIIFLAQKGVVYLFR